MESKEKIIHIALNAIPVVLMIGLIPLVSDDYLLTGAYISIMVISCLIKREKNDFLFLVFGFTVMIVSEYFFISTGVEVFNRQSLFGVMPLWLPFLWAYAFVSIKRGLVILNKDS